MLAATPGLLAPCGAKNPIASQRSLSGSLVRITWAHLRPGRFHAFDADVAVRAWAAAASDVDAQGMWRSPGETSAAWISSAKTRPPGGSTTAVSCYLPAPPQTTAR